MIRRLIGLRRVRVITGLQLRSASALGFHFEITEMHSAWERVRPWWAVWR